MLLNFDFKTVVLSEFSFLTLSIIMTVILIPLAEVGDTMETRCFERAAEQSNEIRPLSMLCLAIASVTCCEALKSASDREIDPN